MPLVINSTEFNPALATSISGAHSNTGGQELVAFLAHPIAAGAPSLVQYGGINLTSIQAQAVSNNVRAHILRLSSPAAESNTFSVQWPGATDGIAVCANWPESKGILQSTGGTQTVDTSGSLATTSNTELASKIYMIFAGANLSAFTETSGATLIHSQENTSALYEKAGTGGVVTFTWTIGLSARDMAFALCEIGNRTGGNQVIWIR